MAYYHSSLKKKSSFQSFSEKVAQGPILSTQLLQCDLVTKNINIILSISLWIEEGQPGNATQLITGQGCILDFR